MWPGSEPKQEPTFDEEAAAHHGQEDSGEPKKQEGGENHEQKPEEGGQEHGRGRGHEEVQEEDGEWQRGGEQQRSYSQPPPPPPQHQQQQQRSYSQTPPPQQQRKRGNLLHHGGGGPRGRLYHVAIPIRCLSGNIAENHLDRLALYYPIYGAFLVLAGLVAVFLPVLASLTIPDVLAWVLVVCGTVSLIQFLLICGAPGTLFTLLIGALHLGAGLWLLLQPIEGSTALSFIISLWFIAHGLLKAFMTITVRKVTTWPFLLVSGVASFILAFVILAVTPSRGLKILAIAFGADLAFTGIAMLLISLMAYLGKGHRSVTDAEAIGEPLMGGRG